MKKYLFVSAIAAMALASCTNDTFLGEPISSPPPSATVPEAISFNGSRSNLTRANTDLKDAAAAQALGNNFIVYGVKTKDATKTTVYNYYNVNWKNKDNTNSPSWVYEGEEKNALNTNSYEGKQTIKYWDYSATNYDFTAFTLGKDITVTRKDGESGSAPTYTFTGNYQELQNCYIADRIVATPGNNNQPVQFTFHSTGTKVGLSIYETIPGYSIKDIKFYDGDEEGEYENIRLFQRAILYAKTSCIPENHANGTLTVTYDENNKAKTVLQEATPIEEKSETKSNNIAFNNFTLNAGKEYNESDDVKYLGRTKNDATSTGLKAVSPCNIDGGLTLKIDYTLVSTDGSGEEIKVKGATAQIPEDYTKWETNHTYSYVFSITDKTNGTTGGSQAGLYPIVFDAVVIEETDGTSSSTETVFDKTQTGTTTPSGGE